MRRLKVANLLASRGRGGLELHYVQLCNHLTEHVDVTAITHPEFASQLDPAVRFIPLDVTRSRRNPFLLWQLLGRLQREPFDVIHGQANKAVSLLSTLRPFLRPPLIGTLHNLKPDTRMFARMDHVIGVSRLATAIVSSVPTTVIYNGLPELQTSSIDLHSMFNLHANRPVLLAVGRLVPAKGFDVLIDAVAPLNATFLIAGDGPDAGALQAIVRDLDAEDRIRFLGYRDDIPSLIAACDGVVISSRREGFSYVAAEALVLGQRLLATDVPVANEILPDELIVPIEDASALRNRLAELLSDPEHWSHLVAPAVAFARREFSISNMVSKTVEVYRGVVHQSPSTARAGSTTQRG